MRSAGYGTFDGKGLKIVAAVSGARVCGNKTTTEVFRIEYLANI